MGVVFQQKNDGRSLLTTPYTGGNLRLPNTRIYSYISIMSEGYKIRDQYAAHFITPTVVDWVDVFTRNQYRDVIIDSLAYCIKARSLRLYGYVVMTNHLHLIARSENGTLSDTLRDFKKYTANHLIKAIKNEPESRREWMLHRFEWNAAQNKRNSENQLWTHDNRPEEIYSKEFFDQKLNYIPQIDVVFQQKNDGRSLLTTPYTGGNL